MLAFNAVVWCKNPCTCWLPRACWQLTKVGNLAVQCKLGADLAYQYGKTGSLSNIGLSAAQTMLGNTQFGQVNQAINQVGLGDGVVRLSA